MENSSVAASAGLVAGAVPVGAGLVGARPALVGARAAVGASTRAGERMQLSVEFLEFIQREMDGIARRWEEHKATRG